MDEVGRVHMFQRRRERKRDFRGDFVPEWAHLVHMSQARGNAKKLGSYTPKPASWWGGLSATENVSIRRSGGGD